MEIDIGINDMLFMLVVLVLELIGFEGGLVIDDKLEVVVEVFWDIVIDGMFDGLFVLGFGNLNVLLFIVFEVERDSFLVFVMFVMMKIGDVELEEGIDCVLVDDWSVGVIWDIIFGEELFWIVILIFFLKFRVFCDIEVMLLSGVMVVVLFGRILWVSCIGCEVLGCSFKNWVFVFEFGRFLLVKMIRVMVMISRIIRLLMNGYCSGFGL